MSYTNERWPSDDKRCDGLTIVAGADGFVILPRDDSVAVDRCPCCDKALRTMKAARLVADMICPMTRDS